MDMGTRRFGVAQTAADMCQVTKENIMEFAERMNRFGEGVFSRLAEINVRSWRQARMWWI